MFKLTPLTFAGLLVHLDWLTATPTSSVCLSKMNRRKALAYDFQDVFFETFIVCDNFFSGLLTLQDYQFDEVDRVAYKRKFGI